MTIHVEGRGIYRQNPSFKIYRGHNAYDDPAFTVSGGELDIRETLDEFRVISKHENGTDIEHDAAYVLELKGAGLSFKTLYNTQVQFTGVLYEARYYPPDFEIKAGASLEGLDVSVSGDKTITLCEDTEYYHPDTQTEWPAGHLMMPFMPPRQKLKPGIFTIVVEMPCKEVES